MHRTLATAVVTALVSASLADEPKALLFYGNSFSQTAGGVHLIVADIAEAAGHARPHVYGRLVGGQTLTWHYATGASFIIGGIPAGRSWDAVVLQEYSTRPTDNPSFADVPAFRQAVTDIFAAVRSHSPGAACVLFETWARGPGHSYYPAQWPDPATMQAELRHYYGVARDDQRALHGPDASEVAPVGDAFESAGFPLGLYASDIYHASNRGGLLIGLVLYGTIYNDASLSDIDLTAAAARIGVSPADIPAIVTWAESVLQNCPPDIDGDGLLTFADVSAFVTAFSTADPAADANSDGVVDFGDVSAFVAAFASGCPAAG